MRFIILAGLFMLCPLAAKAQESPIFSLPVDCIPNMDCWVANYVDMDMAEGKTADPACLDRTYDGHKGTDFAVRDTDVMNNGINVLAAANGTVLRLRDGQEDKIKTEDDLKVVEESGTECGNGILIDHGDGYQTMYCHLKKDSIIVKAEDKVKAGQKIGEIGLSGLTQFPHLHFGIHFEGEILDPFTGHATTSGCGKQKQSLWTEDTNLKYEPTSLYVSGFHNDVPSFEEVNKGAYKSDSLPQSSQALTFWFGALGVREGDKVTLKITDPDGEIFSQRGLSQEKTRVRQFYFAGRKATNNPLKAGTYTGQATLERAQEDGKEPLRYSISDSVHITE